MKDNDTIVMTTLASADAKGASAALREADERLHLALEAADAGLWDWDVSGDRIVWSPENYTLYGLDPSRTPTILEWERCIYPADLARVRKAVTEVVSGRSSSYVSEFRILHSVRGLRWICTRGRARRDTSGRVVRIAGIAMDITDRKRAEAAVHDAHGFQTAIAELASDFAFSARVSDSGRVVTESVTEGFARMFGYSLDEVLDRGCFDLMHPDDRALAGAHLQRLLAGDRVEGEIRAVTKSGRTLWLHFAHRPVIDAEGRVVRIYGAARDITAQKAADEALRVNEHRLRVALGASRVGIWDLDLESGRLEWDARVREMWEIGPNDPVDFDVFLERLVPEDRPTVEAAIAAAIAPGGSGHVQTEYRVLTRASASPRWMRATGALFSEPGRPRRLIGSVEDITEQRAYEARIVAEQERYQRIFDVAGVSLWELDWTRVKALFDRWRAEGIDDPAAHCMADAGNLDRVIAKIRVIRVNRETLRLYEAPSREALLRALPTLVLPEARAQWGVILRAFANGESRVEVERPALTLTGRRVEQLISFSFGERAERAESVLVSLVDVTPLKQAAAVLRESNRRKDEFLAMLAHELRNPLAPIRNAAELLRFSASGDSRVAWAREMIDRQLVHLSRLIDDLLDVSRIVQGKVRIERAPLDLCRAIEQAVETSRAPMNERGHAFTLSMPPHPVAVKGDFVRLTQVFSNLLDNAAKYTPAGGRVSLTLEATAGEAIVRVRDSGEGIPREIEGEIFELFTQGSRSLDRAQGGLGIGLTVVKRMVEMHGGRVTASSAGPGLGSEFRVVLPRVAEAVTTPAAPETQNGPHATRRSVLVVDDNRDAADSLAALLQMEGCAVEVALDGPTAVAQARRAHPEVVVLDIGLPGMDGFEVARALRMDDTMRDALIIAATGYGREEDRLRAIDAGCDHHLVKPIDFSDLLSLMAEGDRPRSPRPSRQ